MHLHNLHIACVRPQSTHACKAIKQDSVCLQPGPALQAVIASLTMSRLQTSGLCAGCRRTVLALEMIAQKKADAQLTLDNKHALALTHGFAHGVVQSILFSIR